jgi:hypothetical protein
VCVAFMREKGARKGPPKRREREGSKEEAAKTAKLWSDLWIFGSLDWAFGLPRGRNPKTQTQNPKPTPSQAGERLFAASPQSQSNSAPASPYWKMSRVEWSRGPVWLTSAYPRGWSESPRAPLPKRGLKKVRRGMIADPLGVEHYATRSPDGKNAVLKRKRKVVSAVSVAGSPLGRATAALEKA